MRLSKQRRSYAINLRPTKCHKPKIAVNTLHKYASTDVQITDEAVLTAILGIQLSLDPSDVTEYTDRPHITVRWGLHDQIDLPSKVQNIIQSCCRGEISVQLQEISVFDITKVKDGTTTHLEVLKIGVYSPHLHVLNKALKSIPNTETYEYSPHMTIAWTIKGGARKYLTLKNVLNNTTLGFNTVTLTDKNGSTTKIRLDQSTTNTQTVGYTNVAIDNILETNYIGQPRSHTGQYTNPMGMKRVVHQGEGPVSTDLADYAAFSGGMRVTPIVWTAEKRLEILTSLNRRLELHNKKRHTNLSTEEFNEYCSLDTYCHTMSNALKS